VDDQLVFKGCDGRVDGPTWRSWFQQVSYPATVLNIDDGDFGGTRSGNQTANGAQELLTFMHGRIVLKHS